MLQDLIDLDFDAYFDVATSNQQQPPLHNRQQFGNNFDVFNWGLINQTASTLSPSQTSSESCLSPPQLLNNEPQINNQFFTKKALFSINATPELNILPSPPLDNLNLTPFAIENWPKVKNEESNNHEPRIWRKLSSRNQQLQALVPNTSFFEPGKQLKKVAHNAIEKRYRNNINERICELKNVVPALYKAKIKEKGDNDDDSSDSETLLDGVKVAKKLNKATILKKATEYIDHLKYTNEKTEQENHILQQIIAQMPGGHDILDRFLLQKSAFEQKKQEQLARERREKQDREKLERQRVLRERAAQRAALAQILPKPERKPYRRRQSSKTKSDNQDKNNKMFMVAFMCLVFFTASPSSSSSSQSPNDHFYDTIPRSMNTPTLTVWNYLRYIVYAIGIIYIAFIPFILRWLRPRPIHSQKSCLEHHHYASEVPTAWNKLYTNLVSIINKSTKDTNNSSTAHILITLYDLSAFTLSLCTPRSLLVHFHKHSKPVGCPEELAYSGAWIRLNEVECLGANPDITRLGMLHSCMGMLSQLHKMKRDEKHAMYFESSTLARVYATVAIQLELCLPPFVSRYLSGYCWQKTNHVQSAKCHDQVLSMLRNRNGFNNGGCRNVFYSFVLPYITSPLDLVLYWQQLELLEQDWHAYLNGVRPVFSKKQLDQVGSVSVTTTAPGYMLQWWVRVGLALESLNRHDSSHLDALAEYTRHPSNHPSSNLLRQYQTMIFYMVQAASALQTNKDTDKVPQYLQKALKERGAALECIDQIAATENFEASVLVLSLLAVDLRTLKALIHHQRTTSSHPNNEKLPASQASVYIAELRDQVLQDLESPYAQSLSVKCEKFIQSFIAQADDTLCL